MVHHRIATPYQDTIDSAMSNNIIASLGNSNEAGSYSSGAWHRDRNDTITITAGCTCPPNARGCKREGGETKRVVCHLPQGRSSEEWMPRNSLLCSHWHSKFISMRECRILWNLQEMFGRNNQVFVSYLDQLKIDQALRLCDEDHNCTNKKIQQSNQSKSKGVDWIWDPIR